MVELPTQVLLIINNRLDAKEITLSLTMNINASHLTHLVFIDVYISYFSWIKRYFLSKIQSKEKIKPSKSNNSKGKTSNNINELCFSNFHTFSTETALPSEGEPFITMIKVSLSDKQNISLLNKQYVGIVNEGYTCYMNTIIQTIYHLPFLSIILKHATEG